MRLKDSSYPPYSPIVAIHQPRQRPQPVGWVHLACARHASATGLLNKVKVGVFEEVVYEDDVPIGKYWMNDYVMRKELVL